MFKRERQESKQLALIFFLFWGLSLFFSESILAKSKSKSRSVKSPENFVDYKQSEKKAKNELRPVSLKSKSKEAYFRGEKVVYDSEREIFEIIGNSVLEVPADNLEISADLIRIYKKEQRAEAFGKIIISGQEQVSFADHLNLDFSEKEKQTGKLEKIRTATDFSLIQANKALIKEYKGKRTIEYFGQGRAKSDQIIRIASQGRNSLIIRNHASTSNEEIKNSKQSYFIKAKKIDFYNDRIQNNLIIKGARLKFKNFPLSLPLPFYPLTVGDSSQQMFGLSAGSRPNTGARDFNLGPELSFVLGDPSKKRAFHVSPFLQLGDEVGYGGSLRYTAPLTNALIAYGSLKDRLLVEFDQKIFGDYLKFQYANNSYAPEPGIVKHFAELYHENDLTIPFFGGILQNEELKIRLGAAYAQDSQALRDEENNRISDLQSERVQTVKDRDAARFEMELIGITKPIFEYKRGDSLFSLNFFTNLTARQYTTGDFNGFFRFSPTLRAKFSRYLDLEVAYNQLEAIGESPFGFDAVLLGSSSMNATVDLSLSRNFGLTASGTYSYTNREYLYPSIGFVVGPDNLKLAFSYDLFRQLVTVQFSTFFNDIFKFQRARLHQRKNLRRKKRFSSWF